MSMKRSIPALPVHRIPEAADFYRDRLGFAVGYSDAGFAILKRDAVELHLWAAGDDGWRGRGESLAARPVVSGAETFLAGTASCRIEVEGIDELYAEYRSQGVLYGADSVVTVEPWGSREFPALDLHRNLLTFFEPSRGE